MKSDRPKDAAFFNGRPIAELLSCMVQAAVVQYVFHLVKSFTFSILS